MSRKKETITLALDPEQRAVLEQLADRHNCRWGKSPNISSMLRAISNGDLLIVNPAEDLQFPTLTAQQAKALKAAIKALSDAGDFNSVKHIAELLAKNSVMD